MLNYSKATSNPIKGRSRYQESGNFSPLKLQKKNALRNFVRK